MSFILSGHFSHKRTLPTLKVNWLKIVLPLVASSWQYQHKAARQVFKRSATNPLPFPNDRIYETTAALNPTLLFFFMSFTAVFLCESHHLRFNRRAPQKAVLFHVLAAFRLVALLYYKLISSLWDDGTHLRFCFTSLPLRTTAAIHIREHPRAHTRACTHPAVAFNCMAIFRAYMAHGVPSLQRSVRSLLISSVCRLGSLLRACHGRVTSLDDRTTCFQAVMSQTHQNRALPFHRRFHFVATPSCKSIAPPKASLDICWRCILKF